MAITITTRGTYQSKSPTSTWAIDASFSITSGKDYIVVISHDVATYHANGVYHGDTSHKFTKSVEVVNAGNVQVSIWHRRATRTTSTNLSVRFTSSVIAKAATVYEITGLDATPFDKSSTAIGSGTAPNSGATATLSQADELIIGACGVEDEVDDMSGTWTTGAGNVSGNEQQAATNGGGDASNVGLYTAAEVVAATTAQTAEVTGTDSIDWAAAVATYKGAAAGDTFNRSVAVTIASSPGDSVARLGVFGRAPSVSIAPAPSLARAGIFLRAVSATVASSPTSSLARAVAKARALSVTVASSPASSLGRILVLGRGLSISISPTVTVARIVTNLRGLAFTGSVAASVSRILTNARSLTNTVASSPVVSVARATVHVRARSFVGSISTSLARSGTFGRSLSFVGSISLGIAKAIIEGAEEAARAFYRWAVRTH